MNTHLAATAAAHEHENLGRPDEPRRDRSDGDADPSAPDAVIDTTEPAEHQGGKN